MVAAVAVFDPLIAEAAAKIAELKAKALSEAKRP